MRLRLGTRGSALATAQSGEIASRLRNLGHPVDVVVIRSQGDDDARSLAQIGGQGAFTAALSRALLENKIDLAVHSLKDLPTLQMDGLVLGAVPQREDPRDALVTRWGSGPLPEGSRVGTGSLRRGLQLAALGRHRAMDLRGNVDTRLNKLLSGEYDAVMLAMAGLKRLGLTPSPESGWELSPLETGLMTPAVGQGALGIECRADQPEVLAALQPLEHGPSRRAVLIERTLLSRMGGGCQVPFAAHVDVRGTCHLMLADPATNTVVCRLSGPADQAQVLYARMAQDHKAVLDRIS